MAKFKFEKGGVEYVTGESNPIARTSTPPNWERAIPILEEKIRLSRRKNDS